MIKHYREEDVPYEVKISKGFTELKSVANTANSSEPIRDYRQEPADKTNMVKYRFGGFQKCLYPEQKFHSDSERRLAVILEREAQKWFKPARGQFQIYYKQGADHPEYQPDFVAETDSVIYMLEPKAKNEMADPVVLAKKEAAEKWCERASAYNVEHCGKPWKYVLIPHDAITDNKTLEGMAATFGSHCV
jgi:type III restriction enzyme